jgi:hypothetical protein
MIASIDVSGIMDQTILRHLHGWRQQAAFAQSASLMWPCGGNTDLDLASRF